MSREPSAFRTVACLFLGIVGFTSSACDDSRSAATPTGADQRMKPDSSLIRHQALVADDGTGPAWGSISVAAGDQIRVSAAYVMINECISIDVAGVLNEVVLSGLGACGGPVPEQDGTGMEAIIGPAPTTGILTFRIVGQTGSTAGSFVSGSDPSYQVNLYDALGDDLNDVILDVVIENRPGLRCTPSMERGQLVTCRVTGPNTQPTLWKFTTPGRQPITWTSTSLVWEGTAVIGGEVEVAYTQNGTAATEPLQTIFDVTPRPSQWFSMMSYTEGTMTSYRTADDTEPALGGYFGLNCPIINNSVVCAATRRVQPDPYQQASQGVTYKQVIGGPNHGLWWIEDIHFEMRRAGNVNPAIRLESSRQHVLTGKQGQACGRHLGLGRNDTVRVNFFTFNSTCQGINMGNFVLSALGHEGWGAGYSGVGHERLGRSAAQQPGNDPHAVVEAMVYEDPVALDNDVISLVKPIADRITTAANDPNPTGNWPGGDLWLWSEPDGAYVKRTVNGF